MIAGAASTVRFALADRSHDAGIRRLLRESTMEGDIELSMRCEPSYFAAMAELGGETHTIVALCGEEIVCVGSINIRDRYFNGRSARTGYLGHLRLARTHFGRYDILRRGYKYFRELWPQFAMDVCFTSVAADNIRAQRFLESDVRTMPAYRPVGELLTLLVRIGRFQMRPDATRKHETRFKLAEGDVEVDAIMECLCEAQHKFQWAPCWSKHEIEQRFQSGTSAHLIAGDGSVVGFASLWDQRPFKQAVVAGYSRRLSLFRPLHNLFSATVGIGVRLPRPGTVLANAFVTPLITPSGDPNTTSILINGLMNAAQSLGIGSLAIGLDARDPRAGQIIRDFRPHVYRTRLYTVGWSNKIHDAPDGRLMYPEIALL